MQDMRSIRSGRRAEHVCLPFETDDEKSAAVVSFVREGLTQGARCLFVGTPDEYRELGTALERRGICPKRAAARGALLFGTSEEIYLMGGTFDPERTLTRFHGMIDEALAAGFTGLWGTAELSHVPNDVEWKKMVWYEAQVNERFARRPFAGLCRYPQRSVPAERVQDVLRTHPIASVRGEICDNPFYERPDLAVSDDNQTRLDWQLRQLRIQERARQHLEGKTVSAVNAAVELAIELDQLRSRLREPSAAD
jgi:hypothetical protein